jgi:DNA-binding transcriptional ArsR family regulator
MNTPTASPQGVEIESRGTPSDILSALNHPLRRSILRLLLKRGPATATQMADRMSYVTPNNVRFHLDELASSGIVTKEKLADARGSVYSPTSAPRASWVQTVLKLTAGED